MKQYYESEVLFQLMEREGFNIPSSVPPYESEIKAYLINQVKQAYPKLTDYEAEWLLYNYTKHLPADFPISSVTNATSATFENVVPFAYQNAVLKGQTLVNVNRDNFIATTDVNDDFMCPIPFFDCDMKPNTQYTIFTYGDKPYNYRLSEMRLDLEHGLGIFTVGTPFILTTDVNFTALRGYLIGNTLNIPQGTEIKILIVEGDHSNENIPYFEGMKSVKTPVLTTTGRNLVNLDKSNPDGLGNQSGNGSSAIEYDNDKQGFYTKTHRGMYENIAVKPNTYYTISADFLLRENNAYSFLWREPTQSTGDTYESTNFSATEWRRKSVTRLSDENGKINWIVYGGVYFKNLQIEEGSTATSYEPYQSNTLTTPSDLELRGIGGVQDTLDCLTGEVVQNIYEFTMDGSQRIDRGDNMFYYYVPFPVQNNISISDKFPSITVSQILNGVTGISAQNRGDTSRVYININGITTKEDMQNYFLNNPTTIQLVLSNKSIKSVDLTTVNEKGETTHFMPLEGTMSVQSSGESIQPTFDMSVPVEATTQNLASFINMEMEG